MAGVGEGGKKSHSAESVNKPIVLDRGAHARLCCVSFPAIGLLLGVRGADSLVLFRHSLPVMLSLRVFVSFL